jgi:hypothetical protein
MSDQKLYRIEELCTMGWHVLNGKLNQEECSIKYKEYLNEGISIKRLRVVRDDD